jgi:hypothetical protein
MQVTTLLMKEAGRMILISNSTGMKFMTIIQVAGILRVPRMDLSGRADPKGNHFSDKFKYPEGSPGAKPKKVTPLDKVPVPPYYPDVPEVRKEIAHHYDCLLFTDDQVGTDHSRSQAGWTLRKHRDFSNQRSRLQTAPA